MKHILTTFMIACAASASGQSLTDSLIAHFPMDGSPNDTVGGLVPMVTSGSPTFCADRFGDPAGAACFDGASFWSYGDTLDMDTSDFSMALWVNIDSIRLPFEIQPGFVSEGSFIAGKGTTIYADPMRAGYSLIGTNNGGGELSIYGISGNNSNDVRLTSSAITTDTWTHLTFSRCGDHQFIHLNGIMVADSVVPDQRNLNVNTVFSIGAMNRDPSTQPDSEWLIGSVDDLRVYKGRCLSQSEIDTLAGTITTGLPSPPVLSDPGMSLLPNPAQDRITVRFDHPVDSEMRLNIMDASGRVVSTSGRLLNIVPQGVAAIEIPLDGMVPGLYFVRFTSQQGTWYERFIME